MPQEIVSQSDQFGLPEQHRETISQEKIAEQLAPAQPWQGPGRLDEE
jgi:hypothetical protein